MGTFGVCSDLIVSALDSGSSGSGSSPGRGHCVVFLGKILHCHGASLHPGVKLCYKGLKNAEIFTPRWTNIPSRGSRNTPSLFMLLEPR